MNILKCLVIELVGLLALLGVAVGYALIWWLWLPGWAVLFVGLFILADAWAVRWAIDRYIERRGFLDPALIPDQADIQAFVEGDITAATAALLDKHGYSLSKKRGKIK